MSELYYFLNIEQQSLDIRISNELLDDIEITQMQHDHFFQALNNDCLIFEDLSCSEPRPSAHHAWIDSSWVDTRSDEEKRAQYLFSLKPLTRCQFKLILLEHNLLTHIENAISAIEDDKTRARIQIEYTEATEFHRSSESVIYMCSLLELTVEQVDAMWEQALKI